MKAIMGMFDSLNRRLLDPAVEQKMLGHLVRLMQENETPGDQFERLGLVNVEK